MNITLQHGFTHFYRIEGWSPFLIKKVEPIQRLLDETGQQYNLVERDGMASVHMMPMLDMLSCIGSQTFKEIRDIIIFPTLLFVDADYNLVTDEGETELLNRGYNDTTITDAIGLTDSTPTVDETDTMGSHAGWAEVTAYSEASRPALNMGTASGGSIDNSANKAAFSIDTNNTTIGGAFASTDNTIGGTTGILLGVAAFDAGDKSLDNNDTLNVTVTGTAS